MKKYPALQLIKLLRDNGVVTERNENDFVNFCRLIERNGTVSGEDLNDRVTQAYLTRLAGNSHKGKPSEKPLIKACGKVMPAGRVGRPSTQYQLTATGKKVWNMIQNLSL